ncbi:MAG: hypothetical protein ACE366_16670 [Bradymonadia bacterium]
MSACVLVLLDVAGARHGFEVEGEGLVVSIDGDEVEFAEGIALDSDLPARSVSLQGSSSSGGTISLALDLEVLDLWAIRDGVPIQTINVRIWWWPDDEPFDEQLHEIYRGQPRSPTWDLEAGQVRFEVAAPSRVPDVQFPPSAVGDEDRFPDAPSNSAGQAVPVIYGRARGVPLPALDAAPSPAPEDPADYPARRFLVAGHPIRSTTIQVRDPDGAALGTPKAVEQGTDGRGEPYSYVTLSGVDLDGVGDAVHAEEVEGWVAPEGRLLDALGDVLLHLWGTYAGEDFHELDRARAWYARTGLNRYRVAFVFNRIQTGGTLLRTIASRIQSQFPVSVGLQGGRMGWDCTALPGPDAVVQHTLTYGQDVHDRSQIGETSIDDVLTEISLSYAFDGFEGSMTKIREFTPENHGGCQGALTRYGPSGVSRLEAPDAPDDGTAFQLLTQHARTLNGIRDTVAYSGLPTPWFLARPLDVVAVTDAAAGWTERKFLVLSVQPTLFGDVSLALLSLEAR